MALSVVGDQKVYVIDRVANYPLGPIQATGRDTVLNMVVLPPPSGEGIVGNISVTDTPSFNGSYSITTKGNGPGYGMELITAGVSIDVVLRIIAASQESKGSYSLPRQQNKDGVANGPGYGMSLIMAGISRNDILGILAAMSAVESGGVSYVLPVQGGTDGVIGGGGNGANGGGAWNGPGYGMDLIAIPGKLYSQMYYAGYAVGESKAYSGSPGGVKPSRYVLDYIPPIINTNGVTLNVGRYYGATVGSINGTPIYRYIGPNESGLDGAAYTAQDLSDFTQGFEDGYKAIKNSNPFPLASSATWDKIFGITSSLPLLEPPIISSSYFGLDQTLVAQLPCICDYTGLIYSRYYQAFFEPPKFFSN